jgi:hypothetical protein
MSVDRGIARGELRLVDIEELKILLEDEQVFGSVVAIQSGGDVGLGCVTR